MRKLELVLLGGPNSGKTHFAGQFYGRLQRRPGLLKIRKEQGTPADITALEEVLQCLEDGHAAEHTHADTSVEILLPLHDKQGNSIDLHWPDYGGEQLQTVFKQRAIPEKWCSRLTKADGWILLIRLKSETTYSTKLSELINRSSNGNDSAKRAGSWDANAYWVELLQLMLHVSGRGIVEQLKQPRLAVLLSCYDELEGDNIPPHKLLAQHLPLVSSFINSNWISKAVSVWGLSALGRPLTKDSSDDDFIDEGPEEQGWIVPPEGGEIDPDLSKPLAWLLETM